MCKLKHVLSQFKLVNSSLTDVMVTKFWIIIFVFLSLITTNIFKLKFIEFDIKKTIWLKWRLNLADNKS
jgi:hypothetical protein